MGIERIGLEHHRHAAFRRIRPGHVAPADRDAAVGGFLKSRDHPQQGGLATARRADENAELAVIDLQVDPVDHLHLTVSLDGPVECYA